jgi:hypothetical protein
MIMHKQIPTNLDLSKTQNLKKSTNRPCKQQNNHTTKTKSKPNKQTKKEKKNIILKCKDYHCCSLHNVLPLSKLCIEGKGEVSPPQKEGNKISSKVTCLEFTQTLNLKPK